MKKMAIVPPPSEIPGRNATIREEGNAKERGLDGIEKDITNYQNLQYYSDLYIGESKQKLSFIYDTGSSYLWVPLESCAWNYTANKFQIAPELFATATAETIFYGSGNATGVQLTEQVAATSDTKSVSVRKYYQINTTYFVISCQSFDIQFPSNFANSDQK